MVQRLLRLREDIFDEYTEEAFSKHLQDRAQVVRVVDVSATIGSKLTIATVRLLTRQRNTRIQAPY